MGFIRKTIAGGLGIFTGGVSLGVIQFRSDTERGAYQTKLLRQQEAQIARKQKRLLKEQLKINTDYLATQQAQVEQMARINSPTAPSLPQSADASPPLETSNERLKNLERLHNLYLAGGLTEDQFEQAKADLLKR